MWMRFMPVMVVLVMMAFMGVVMMGGGDDKNAHYHLLGKPLPTFIMKALGGEGEVKAADLVAEKRPILINFFASWCVPCVAEAEYIKALSIDEELLMVGIVYKDSEARAKDFLQKHGNPFEVIGFDDEGRTAIEFGVAGVPETILVDAQGVIRFRHVGPITAEHIQMVRAKIATLK
jgi:cytochrome c biogenesis protein CcmG/thiol:disulfide interchange protein DsbE